MGRTPGRPARHGPFSHLYLRTIMMVLASVATTSFDILLLFSLQSCLRLRATPFSAEGVGVGVSPHIRPTPAPTPTHVVAIALPRGRFTACAHHRFHRRRTSCSCSRPSPCSFQHAAPVHGRSRELTDAHQRGYGRVGLSPSLSLCVPPRWTWWRLPRLCYLGDEESRSEILDNQGP
jgi:hypothetical protein